MTYQEGPVRPELARLLDCTWTLEVSDQGSMHFVPPDACVNLSIQFFEGMSRASYRMPNMAPLVTEAYAGERFVGVRFQPGAHRLVDLDAVIDSLQDTEDEDVQSAILAAVRPEEDKRVAVIVERIRQSKGLAPVQDIADEVGFSTRQVQRIILEAIGMTPKQFSRITRLQRAIRTMIAENDPVLAHIAAEAGYSDQSHMTREFTQLTGVSPTEYLRHAEQIEFKLSPLF